MRKYLWILAALPVVLGSCRHMWGKMVRGNGHVTTEERITTNFKSVDVSGEINVIVSQGSQPSVKIEGDENLLPYIEVTQEGDKVFVKDRDNYDLHPSGDMRIYVTAPVFNELQTSGASDITGQGKITNPEEMGLQVSGAGNITMELDAPRVKAEISGSGSIRLKGETKDVQIDLSGVGSARCYDLMAENADVNVSGVGSADVFSSVKLNAEVSGVGSVHYKGSPKDVSQHVSGVGSISKTD